MMRVADPNKNVNIDTKKYQSCQPYEDEGVDSLKLKQVRWSQP